MRIRLRYFLASVFIGKASCSQDTQPPEVEDGDREEDEASIIQWEAVSDLLAVLNIRKFMGLNWFHPSVLKELAEALTKSPLITCQ